MLTQTVRVFNSTDNFRQLRCLSCLHAFPQRRLQHHEHIFGENRICFPGDLHGGVRHENHRLRFHDASGRLPQERMESTRFYHCSYRVSCDF